MKKLLNLENFSGKDHFNFFNRFEEPFFGVCVELDCTHAYQYCKKNGTSFFLHYLHKSLTAANQIEPFRYKIEGEQIYVYDQVSATPTIDRGNGNFGFSYITYFQNFDEFQTEADKIIENVRKSDTLFPENSIDCVIQYSVLPGVFFTSLSHARSFSYKDSSPKITFGKLIERDGKRIMPVSIHVHHALMGGYHVGKYIEAFQQLMDRD